MPAPLPRSRSFCTRKILPELGLDIEYRRKEVKAVRRVDTSGCIPLHTNLVGFVGARGPLRACCACLKWVPGHRRLSFRCVPPLPCIPRKIRHSRISLNLYAAGPRTTLALKSEALPGSECGNLDPCLNSGSLTLTAIIINLLAEGARKLPLHQIWP